MEVSVTGDGAGGVLVQVANPAPPARGDTARTGTGLASLAERVRVLGGTFRAGPVAGRWVLRAELPAAREETAR